MASYVSLILPRDLDPDTNQLWLSTVEQTLPSGLRGSTEIVIKGQLKTSDYYAKRMSNGAWNLVVPLVRDLEAHEIYQLVGAWNTAYPEGDFVIDHSQQPTEGRAGVDKIQGDNLSSLLTSWCKSQHNQWMQSMLDRGWQYGVKLCSRSRTHPWLQPWESLPAAAQEGHLQAFGQLMDALDQFGYAIVQIPQA